MGFIQSLIEKYIENYRRQRSWQKLATVLAAVVVFCTTYALILPAITWEKQLICEQPEHVHTDACYEEIDLSEIAKLATDSEEYGKIVFATDSNAATAKVLVCEIPEHTHTEACFDAPPAEKTQWLCGMEQHVHDESCYFEDGSLKCTLQEHVHTEECDCIIMDDVTPVEGATLSELEDATLSEVEDATISEIDLIDQTLTAEAEDGIQFTAEGFMPDGAELVVQALNDEEKESISENVDDIPTRAKAYAYDIKIMLDGEEYKCDDSIRISMTGIEVSDEERVHGYHLPDVDKDNIDKIATATASETVKVEEIGVIQVADEVIFDAEEFSVYYFTVDFTVDFKYNDEQYSIDGHSEGISLSEIMYRLGVRVDASASDADYDDATDSDADYELASGSDAEFDFPTLSARELGVENITWEGEAEPYLIVSEIEDDWWLAPTGEPFTVSGTLTLYFEDGSTEEISVKDAATYTGDIKRDTVLHEGDTLGNCNVLDGVTLTFAGTVNVSGKVTIGEGHFIPDWDTVYFKLADDFPNGKVAMRFTSNSAVIQMVNSKKNLYINRSRDDTSSTKEFIIDGGAVWGGTEHSVLGRGQVNNGITGRSVPIIQIGNIAGNMLPLRDNLNAYLHNVVLQNNAWEATNKTNLSQQGGGGIYVNSTSGNLEMTGCTIKDCYHVSNGGAMYFFDNAGADSAYTTNLSNCTISGCDSGYDGNSQAGYNGGAIKTTGVTKLNLNIDGCEFTRNYSNYYGGAIIWFVGSTNGKLTIKDSEFIGNKARTQGGAIDNRAVMELVGNNLFENNTSANGGAINQGIYNGGAGSSSDKQTVSLTIGDGTIIRNNTATSNGGGIRFTITQSADINKHTECKLLIYGGKITNNTASGGNGGGIYISRADDDTSLRLRKFYITVDISGGDISNNTAAGNGGGIYFLCGAANRITGETVDDEIDKIVLESGNISYNHAGGSGGGIYFNKNDGAQYDTAIDLKGGSISGNSAGKNGGGISFGRLNDNNKAGVINIYEGSVSNNVAQDNGGGIYSSGIEITTQTNDGTLALQLDQNQGKYGGGIYLTGTRANAVFSGQNYIDSNTASGSGGGVFIAGGAQFDLTDGLIRNNKALGLTSVNGTAYGNAGKDLGTGGGIYVEQGTLTVGKTVEEQYSDPETGEIKTRTNVLTGVYKNEADFAADDVYAAGTNGTTITLREPSPDGKILLVKDGTGTVFDKNVNWIEDYLPGDTEYELKWTGHHDENKGRFRELTDAQDAQVMDFDKVQLPNNFICATIGPDKMYKIDYYAPDGMTVIGSTFAFKGDEAIVESVEYGGKTYSVWTSQPGGAGRIYNSGYRILMNQDIKLYSSDDPPSPTEYDLEIKAIKHLEPGILLAGARFDVCEKVDDEWKPIAGGTSLITDENGTVRLTVPLEIGKVYRLVETGFPSGYQNEDRTSYFKTAVTSTSPLTISTYTCTETGDIIPYTYVSAEYIVDGHDQKAVVTVSHTAFGGPPLPTTGGCGRDIIYILGLLLLAGGATGLAVTENKRKRRSG